MFFDRDFFEQLLFSPHQGDRLTGDKLANYERLMELRAERARLESEMARANAKIAANPNDMQARIDREEANTSLRNISQDEEMAKQQCMRDAVDIDKIRAEAKESLAMVQSAVMMAAGSALKNIDLPRLMTIAGLQPHQLQMMMDVLSRMRERGASMFGGNSADSDPFTPMSPEQFDEEMLLRFAEHLSDDELAELRNSVKKARADAGTTASESFGFNVPSDQTHVDTSPTEKTSEMPPRYNIGPEDALPSDIKRPDSDD